MARRTGDDYKALSYLFSTTLDGDAFARVGLDEKQEVANRLYKGAVMKITRVYVRKMAAKVEARDEKRARLTRCTERSKEPGKGGKRVAQGAANPCGRLRERHQRAGGETRAGDRCRLATGLGKCRRR